MIRPFSRCVLSYRLQAKQNFRFQILVHSFAKLRSHYFLIQYPVLLLFICTALILNTRCNRQWSPDQTKVTRPVPWKWWPPDGLFSSNSSKQCIWLWLPKYGYQTIVPRMLLPDHACQQMVSSLWLPVYLYTWLSNYKMYGSKVQTRLMLPAYGY